MWEGSRLWLWQASPVIPLHFKPLRDKTEQTVQLAHPASVMDSNMGKCTHWREITRLNSPNTIPHFTNIYSSSLNYHLNFLAAAITKSISVTASCSYHRCSLCLPGHTPIVRMPHSAKLRLIHGVALNLACKSLTPSPSNTVSRDADS